MKKEAKIYIAGHRGLVGSALKRQLEAQGYKNIIYRSHDELDLTNQNNVKSFFKAENILSNEGSYVEISPYVLPHLYLYLCSKNLIAH